MAHGYRNPPCQSAYAHPFSQEGEETVITSTDTAYSSVNYSGITASTLNLFNQAVVTWFGSAWPIIVGLTLLVLMAVIAFRFGTRLVRRVGRVR